MLLCNQLFTRHLKKFNGLLFTRTIVIFKEMFIQICFLTFKFLSYEKVEKIRIKKSAKITGDAIR
jgi:hypothetical protein